MPRLMCPLIPGHQIASDQDPNNLQPIHSQATLRGVHVFRVFANIGVVSFHSMLYWAVIEGTTLQDTLQVF